MAESAADGAPSVDPYPSDHITARDYSPAHPRPNEVLFPPAIAPPEVAAPDPLAGAPAAPPPPPGAVVAESAAAGGVLILADGKRTPVGEELLIGRSSSSGLTINESHISRQHARIVRRDGQFFITDLGSSNGTFVNGVRIKGATLIKDLDDLKIGRTAAQFRVGAPGEVDLAAEFRPATVVEARHLTKIYGSGPTKVVAVDRVDLEVPKGRIELIMGPSGSGKTTLLSMLGCLLRPTSGSITINSREVTKLPERALPQLRLHNIGFIFQSFNLLSSLTALENVAFPMGLAGVRSRRAAARARELLERLGMGDRLHYRPAKLSGGDQQRVAIARALVNDPTIILADEPTGNLDSKSGHAVMEILYRVAKEQDRSVIIVSHDPRIKDIADRILWLEDGRLTLGDRS
jgi:putative ABC transport system ATP-binding protein